MMIPEPNPNPLSNCKPISPKELDAILSQGKHVVNVIGPNNQLAAKTLVIHGIAHGLPLKFGWHPALEAKHFKPEKHAQCVAVWMRRNWLHQ
jgi:hypothetical protein